MLLLPPPPPPPGSLGPDLRAGNADELKTEKMMEMPECREYLPAFFRVAKMRRQMVYWQHASKRGYVGYSQDGRRNCRSLPRSLACCAGEMLSLHPSNSLCPYCGRGWMGTRLYIASGGKDLRHCIHLTDTSVTLFSWRKGIWCPLPAVPLW